MIYRQGDVALRRISEVIGTKVGNGSRILAYGEATGHHHMISGDGLEYFESDGLLLVNVPESAKLVHQEHDALIEEEVTAGVYEVHLQQEMSLTGELRRVMD